MGGSARRSPASVPDSVSPDDERRRSAAKFASHTGDRASTAAAVLTMRGVFEAVRSRGAATGRARPLARARRARASRVARRLATRPVRRRRAIGECDRSVRRRKGCRRLSPPRAVRRDAARRARRTVLAPRQSRPLCAHDPRRSARARTAREGRLRPIDVARARGLLHRSRLRQLFPVRDVYARRVRGTATLIPHRAVGQRGVWSSRRVAALVRASRCVRRTRGSCCSCTAVSLERAARGLPR